MNEKNLLKRWPLASYFILVFLISWGGVIGLGLEDFLGGAQPQLPEVLPMVIMMLGAPLAIGFTMSYVVGGKAGLQDLLARLTGWKVSGRWYLAPFIFPAMILAVQVPLSVWVTADLAPILNPVGIIAGLMAGFQEEIGWMGFAYPKMRQRFSVLRASITLGLIHAVWHTAADFLGNFNAMGADWLPYFAGFFVFVIALRIIIAWIYEHTQSVLMAQLAHAFSTGFLSILVPTANAATIWPTFYAVYAVALWIVAALIIRKNRKSMTVRPVLLADRKPSLQPSGD